MLQLVRPGRRQDVSAATENPHGRCLPPIRHPLVAVANSRNRHGTDGIPLRALSRAAIKSHAKAVYDPGRTPGSFYLLHNQVCNFSNCERSFFSRPPYNTTGPLSPVPSPNTVRAADGKVLTVPDGWVLLPPRDAALTRRVKATGDHWGCARNRACPQCRSTDLINRFSLAEQEA